MSPHPPRPTPPQSIRPSRSPTPSSTRATRLSRACDACSLRKVKCDQEGPPCRACQSLNIPCTFDRPARRRGPPNRHAEALKSQQSQSSPGTAATVELVESLLCPRHLAQRVIDDYFAFVFPLSPIPHEPWFRLQLQTVPEPRFISLLASLMACAASNHPRRLLLHLEDLHLTNLFGSSEGIYSFFPATQVETDRPADFVRICLDVATRSRPQDLFQIGEISVWDAVTSFLMGQAHAAYANRTAAELFLGESLNILQVLGYGQTPPLELSNWPQNSDQIHQQTGRRLYWVIFQNARLPYDNALDTLAFTTSSPSRQRQHPPFPEAVNDESITATAIEVHTAGPSSSIMSGFNASKRIYQADDSLAVLDMLAVIEETVAATVEDRLLFGALLEIEAAFSNLGQEFSLFNDAHTANLSVALETPHEPASRQAIALTLQRLDVYVAYLASKSEVLERAWTPSPMGGRGSPLGHYDPSTERLTIARQLLIILGQTPATLQQARASVLSRRVRQITATIVRYVGQQVQGSFDTLQPGLTAAVREEASYLVQELNTHVARYGPGHQRRGSNLSSRANEAVNDELGWWNRANFGFVS